MLNIIAFQTISAALSRSTSGQTTTGLFPPNSRTTFFKFVYALASRIRRPITVEPVKEILLILLLFVKASPACGPYPGTIFTTPLGNPACLNNAATFKIESGVTSDGFNIIQFPAARAGPNFHSAMSNGKFHGEINPTTP